MHFPDDREENYAAAYYWNGLAARGGHVGAQGRLATIYHEGLGVERNPKEAFRWWYSAAQQRHHGAQMMLAASYELGIVVEADLEEAAYWASLSYTNAGKNPQNLEVIGPYYLEKIIRRAERAGCCALAESVENKTAMSAVALLSAAQIAKRKRKADRVERNRHKRCCAARPTK